MTFYGFESGSDRILIKMNKGATVEDGLKAAQYNHEIRLPFWAMMIFGYPQETWEDVHLSQQFLIGAKPYNYAINLFIPMPGSSIFDELRKTGRINDIKTPYDYRRYSRYGAEGYINFTAMDDLTYKLAYEQLLKVADDVSLKARRKWALREFAQVTNSYRPLKACMIRHYFGVRELKNIESGQFIKDLTLSARLSKIADLLIILEKLKYKSNANPVTKVLLTALLYPPLSIILYINVHIALFLRTCLALIIRCLNFLNYHL